MLLAKLHFKLSTGAHLPLVECQLYQLCFQHTPSEMSIQNGFRSSDCMLDVDWCYDDSLTAPLFARLRQLHSFKQRLLSQQQHCPNSVDSTINTPHPIKGLLSLLLTHHFLVMDVDFYLTCMLVIPITIWFIVLALGLFNSPIHICVCLTDGLPHALSSALLLFHARPWKHPPQSRHSFSSKGPTPSLSVG